MSFWENKNVLITGVTGFVGEHLYTRLVALGATVYGVSKTKSRKRIYKINILNSRGIDELIQKKKIQICFHLAGEALVENGQKNPYNTFKINTEGTLNILESSRKNKLEKVIIASSSHVYGNNKVPYMEEYVPRPSRPYETSKACADLIAQSYADNFNLPILIPRFVNIYGQGDINFHRLIPKTMRSILMGNNPEMWGGNAMRDYIYIDDVINAYLSLGELDKKLMERNRIYNIGTGNIISVKDIINKIINLSKSKCRIKILREERQDEIILQYVSIEKTKRILKWAPKYSLDKGLLSTYEWYKTYLNL